MVGAVGGGSCRGGHRARAARGAVCALIGTVATAALFAGCGGAASAQGTGSPSALLNTLENWSALETPVDQALGILTQQCMAQHGLRYYPFPQAGQPGGPPAFASPVFGSMLWLGPQSLAWRIVNGWGLYEETMAQLSQPGGISGGQPAEFQVMSSLRGQAQQTYMKTLWGGGKTMKIRIPGLPGQTFQIGGCNTTAGKQLFGSVAASVAVPQYGPAILTGSIQPSASRSRAFQASRAAWAACVRSGTGIAAASPSQLFLRFFSLYQSQGPTPAVHRRELAAAITDLRCQRRSRLPQSIQQAALTAVGQLPNAVLGELQTLVGVLDQARVRANAVFGHAQSNVSGSTNTADPQSIAAPSSPSASGGQVVIVGG